MVEVSSEANFRNLTPLYSHINRYTITCLYSHIHGYNIILTYKKTIKMKIETKVKGTILYLSFIITVVYLLISFATWNLNIATWNTLTRMIYLAVVGAFSFPVLRDSDFDNLY